jgi:L-asparaginase
MVGAVVTYKIDVMEEISFFLDATVNYGELVIVVGAMRPSTAISVDGLFNLLEVVTVAESPLAKGRGSKIISHLTKLNTLARLDTWDSMTAVPW